MMDLRRRMLKFAALAPGAAAIAVALWGLAPLPDAWDGPRLTLMLAALLGVSGASYLYLYAQGERDAERDAALQQRLDGLREHIATLRDARDLTAQLRALLELLPERARVLSRYAGNYMLTRLDSILTKEHFEVQGGFFFQDFYREVFKALPACSLIATADATPDYFWKSKDLNDLFRAFKDRGGKLTRVFYLRDPEQLHDPVTQQIMRDQHAAGVEVHWVVRSALPDARYMIADADYTFGWLLRTNVRGEIDHVDVSWNRQTAEERYKYLLAVLKHNSTQAFAP